MKKIAVIRNPQTGFDQNLSFSPGTNYFLINASNKDETFTSSIKPWNNNLDPLSGDIVWHFDFLPLPKMANIMY